MFEKILENIIGLAALGLFGVGLYEWYRREQKAKAEAEIMAAAAAKRAEINRSIQELNSAQIDAKRNYDKAKENVYDIINKRNSSGSNSGSGPNSGRPK
jgi:Flp pilus assembly protein TadB